MDKLTRRERERIRREEEIIAAAEKIFGQKGFESTSMDEIALEAQFTKRTLYQYFENKEDLYFAAVQNAFMKLFSFLQKATETEMSGYMKLQQANEGYYGCYKESPETLRMIGEMGYVKKKVRAESKWFKSMMETDDAMFKWVAEIIEEGKNDGSIRADLDSVKVTISIVFMMTGFFNQLSMTGETFLNYFSLEAEDFSHFSMDLLLGSIKNNEIVIK